MPSPSPPASNSTFSKCEFCSKVFAAKYRLAIHVRTHTGEKPFKCNKCSFACNQRGNLITHLKTHSSGQILKCVVTSCDFTASNDHTMKVHMNKSHNIRSKVSLKKPASTSKMVNEVPKDMKVEIVPGKTTEVVGSPPLKPYKGPTVPPRVEGLTCVFCFKKFWDRFKLQEHLRVHTGERPFNCSQCSFACNKEINLRSHMRSHRGPVVKCSFSGCYFSASNVKTLRKHHAIAHAPGRVQVKTEFIPDTRANADEIPRTSPDVPELQDFAQILPGSDNVEDAAPILNLEESSPQPAKASDKLSINEDLNNQGIYCCPAPDCEYETMYNASLKLHSRLHSSIDPVDSPEGEWLEDYLFQCQSCNFRCGSKKELRIHGKAHTSEEKLFRCPECDYAGGSSLSLRNHKRIHSMPFACSYCSKTSMTKEKIEQHEHYCKLKA